MVYGKFSSSSLHSQPSLSQHIMPPKVVPWSSLGRQQYTYAWASFNVYSLVGSKGGFCYAMYIGSKLAVFVKICDTIPKNFSVICGGQAKSLGRKSPWGNHQTQVRCKGAPCCLWPLVRLYPEPVCVVCDYRTTICRLPFKYFLNILCTAPTSSA
jgi:hypothetical protein